MMPFKRINPKQLSNPTLRTRLASQSTIGPPVQPVIAAPITATPVRPRRAPIGGFRGGITGFLLGTTLSGCVGWYYLLEQYRDASDLLLASVEDLQQSTGRVTGYVRRIEDVEKRVGKIEDSGARREDLQGVRKELKQVFVSYNFSKTSYSKLILSSRMV